MRIACSTASFPSEGLERARARAAWAEFRAVEVALPDGDPAGVDPEALRRCLNLSDLEVAALDAGELGALESEAALMAAARIGRAALLARQLEAPRVVVRAPAIGSLVELAAGLARLLGALEEVPVRIAVANRAGSLLALPEELAELWRLVGEWADSQAGKPAPLVGWADTQAGKPAPLEEPLVERRGSGGHPSLRSLPPSRWLADCLEVALDPADAVLARWDPARALERLPESPRYLYLNDARGGEPVPPGEGDVDWRRLALALAGSLPSFLTLRLAGAEPWAVEPAAREARFLAEEWFPLEN